MARAVTAKLFDNQIFFFPAPAMSLFVIPPQLCSPLRNYSDEKEIETWKSS